MQQLLFKIPGVEIPIYGFGAMFFLAIVSCTIWGIRRGKTIGLNKDNIQDLAFILFVTGIVGARIFYMIQFRDQFEFNGIFGTLFEFVRIDRGGIVFYGCLIGGFFGFMGFRHFVLKRLKISVWQLADVVAPLLALGLAIGRIGCYLNSCCWGQVAVPECQPVPLNGPLCKFPLMSAHAKDQLLKPGEVRPHCRAVQTGTGFVVDVALPTDQRSVVTAVEPGSEAAQAGLQPGDRITKINGLPNQILLRIKGEQKEIDNIADKVKLLGKLEFQRPELDSGILGYNKANAEKGDWIAVVSFEEPQAAQTAKRVAESLSRGQNSIYLIDRFTYVNEEWPLGAKTFDLEVERAGQKIPLTFTPRTVTLFPTQLYETISMILLILLIVAYQPFRRHYGQLFVMYLIGYGMHRYLNETLRVEPIYSIRGIELGLTASQIISLGFIIGGIILEIVLRRTQKKISVEASVTTTK